MIDVGDLVLVKSYSWYAHSCKSRWYAATKSKGQTLFMHRALMKAPSSKEVDHKDGDGLNCRRSNMRIATSAQNKHNTGSRPKNKTGFKGVRQSLSGRWTATINSDGQRTYLGIFQDARAAACAYDAEARELHGEFARLNFPNLAQ